MHIGKLSGYELLRQWQKVTKTGTNIFFFAKYFRYWFRDFFQIFPIPVPRLFSITNFFRYRFQDFFRFHFFTIPPKKWKIHDTGNSWYRRTLTWVSKFYFSMQQKSTTRQKYTSVRFHLNVLILLKISFDLDQIVAKSNIGKIFVIFNFYESDPWYVTYVEVLCNALNWSVFWPKETHFGTARQSSICLFSLCSVSHQNLKLIRCWNTSVDSRQ